MELIRARLVRTTTCANGCKCDYTICGDKDPYLKITPNTATRRATEGTNSPRRQTYADSSRDSDPVSRHDGRCGLCVLYEKSLGDLVQRSLAGFAAGVMVAASIWSLLIPAIEQSAALGKLAFFPAFAGFWLGVLFLLALDHLIPHLHVGSEQAEGPKSRLARTTMMVLAVTLHNIPEGMAVGVMYAGFLAGGTQITAASALALSIGIAIQNFPEGAIISMPLRAEGQKRAARFSAACSPASWSRPARC